MTNLVPPYVLLVYFCDVYLRHMSNRLKVEIKLSIIPCK